MMIGVVAKRVGIVAIDRSEVWTAAGVSVRQDGARVDSVALPAVVGIGRRRVAKLEMRVVDAMHGRQGS